MIDLSVQIWACLILSAIYGQAGRTKLQALYVVMAVIGVIAQIAIPFTN